MLHCVNLSGYPDLIYMGPDQEAEPDQGKITT